MSKKLIFGNDARSAFARGVDAVAEAVKVTMGPLGKPVVFNKGVGPVFSLDGVTVAKMINLKDEAEDNGAQLIISVARETDKSAGDGTTTATVLTQSILKNGLKALAVGIDHTKMKKGIDIALEIVKRDIKENAIPVDTEEALANIATISSRDKEIGSIVAELVYKLGKDAIITVEDSKVLGTSKEIVDGLQIDKGFISPYFINDMQRNEVILDNPYILVTSQVLSQNQDIYRVMSEVQKTDSRSLLIIADTVRGEALATMILNKMHGRLSVCAVAAPSLGEDKIEQLKDFCYMTGAKFVSEEVGIKAEDATLADLGRAVKVIVDKDKTIIVGGHGDYEDRIAQIESEIEKETRDYVKEQKIVRLGRMKGGVAIIRTGTYSEEESMEKKYRIEDAIRSAKSALEEGIVPGAGMMLYKASDKIQEYIDGESDISYRMGATIVKDAIREPARQIILNAGYQPDVILSKCIEQNKGFNSATGQYVDLIEDGVIDPAKVVRVGLENAISISSMFLISECQIIDEVEENKKNTHQE